MSYRVTGALVIAKDQGGKLHHKYHGAVIPWLSDKQAEHFLRHGLVERLDDVPAPVEATESDAGAAAGKPPKVAPKEAWVEYGAANGHDRGELEALNKQELVDLLG
ncbi:hypothetical protein C1Y40_05167 [Mycobacterium talmoniae]|uniref:Uncharacterized protein n=1 Tax=Mycobacterium talmoniae TaxID=1858794 RepID=A0A2S8BDD7_9MYCO|nr:hypothetical protein [Mycobacterium eburneum]PQM44671.1 hypothetical protein C1Y40_05167 [Mycobacterium talmoniae]TDH57544.1 hypothetical protein E2F47_01895 [Mycobacterium eburneum]